MFSNEVLIEKADKERLEQLIKEADAILKKYPYETYDGSHTVTAMTRAKSAVMKAKNCCRCLYVKE